MERVVCMGTIGLGLVTGNQVMARRYQHSRNSSHLINNKQTA